MTPKDKRVIDDVEALAQAADRLFYAMRRSRTAIGDRAAGGLSMAQLALLEPLAEAANTAGLPVSRLAAGAEVSVPTATRMLQQLEAKGLITRHRAPDDERKVLIRLTADGANRLLALRTELRARQFEALSRYSPRERRELTAQLQGLADVIGGSLAGPPR
ncbi:MULTISPECIES: MarR family transcriptional regulator [unclassified Amycolatopsis]|uniref:MarR family winged helix-turn-helix transcriptional regulator n=1 Tax=unclassified Amycolatopsis TaxID=2618356 RepID=UPI003454801E